MILCGFTVGLMLTIVSAALFSSAIPRFVLAGDPRKRSMFIHGGIVHCWNYFFIYIPREPNLSGCWS